MRFNIRLEQNAKTGTWVAHVPAIEDLSAYAETRESALKRVRRAIEAYLELAAESGEPLAAPEDRSEWTELNVALP